MKRIMIVCLLPILLYGCNNKEFLIESNNAKLKEYKNDFDSSFINQFPDKVTSLNANVISNTNRKKNDIGLILYEYEIDKSQINKIRKKIADSALAVYKSNQSCFLIVNRFETEETYQKFEVVDDIDSLELESECAKLLLPVPNFIGSNYSKNKNGLKLDDSFDIYVLESKAGNHFEAFELQPSPQMPDKWKNGYSKGVALSEKNNTIIFWSIIW